MTVSDKINIISPNTNFPVEWCRIFAECVQNVENRLGVPLTARVGGKSNCIFVLPKEISLESIENLNFAGYDYNPDWLNDDTDFEMYTVVGVSRNWYNQHLFKKLKDNPKLIRIIIEIIYLPHHFARMVRINRMAMTLGRFIKDYNSLEDYIRDVCDDGIYLNPLDKSECIARLNKFGVTSGCPIDNLLRYKFKNYNWLEYLTIVTEPKINCRRFINKDSETLAEFEKQLAQHVIIMIVIDLIFTDDPDTVAKVKKLIEELIERLGLNR